MSFGMHKSFEDMTTLATYDFSQSGFKFSDQILVWKNKKESKAMACTFHRAIGFVDVYHNEPKRLDFLKIVVCDAVSTKSLNAPMVIDFANLGLRLSEIISVLPISRHSWEPSGLTKMKIWGSDYTTVNTSYGCHSYQGSNV